MVEMILEVRLEGCSVFCRWRTEQKLSRLSLVEENAAFWGSGDSPQCLQPRSQKEEGEVEARSSSQGQAESFPPTEPWVTPPTTQESHNSGDISV